MTDTTTSNAGQSSVVQAGDLTARLIACRQHAGLDLEQAADEMHLSPALLKSLEEEDFARLPEPPYVRGYLRGYAKLAGSDPKELIHLYESLRGARPEDMVRNFAPARPLVKVTSQPRLSALTMKLIMFAALLLIAGLISQIPAVRDWVNHTWDSFSAQTAPPNVARPAPALNTFTAQKDAEEKAEVITPPPATATPAAPPASPTAAQQDTPAPATTTTVATATPPPATPASKPAETAPATPEGTAPATPTTGTPVAPTTPTTPATPVQPTQPIAGEVNIKMEFADEVWVQVQDQNKKTVFESLNTKGTTKEFKATTPLNFKVGNAQGVKIYLNGQVYDQAPYIKGSVARFKVE